MVFDYDRSLANGGTGVLEFFDTDCFYSYIPDFNFANLCDSLNIQVKITEATALILMAIPCFLEDG